MSNQASAPRRPSKPARTPPPGACDCHAHVFGPFDRFPVEAGLAYLPPPASAEDHLAMLSAVGVSRGVVVQPTAYGLDNSAVVAAMKAAPTQVRCIGVTTSSVSDKDLASWHEAGMRGLRFIEVPDPSSGKRYRGGIGTEELVILAPRLKELGWHAQIWAPIGFIAEEGQRLAGLGIPLVFDHMGMPDPANGPRDPAFTKLLGLLADGVAWAKLSLCRVSRRFLDYGDARPLHDALLRANPDRLVWGSDWPHVRMGDQAPDVGHLLDLLDNWVSDETLARRILADNPAVLYGFGPGNS